MQESREIKLSDIFNAMWSRKWLIIIITIVAALGAAVVTKFFITPQYAATIRLYVNNSTESSATITSSDMTAAKSLVSTYFTVIQSDSVLDSVIDETGLTYYTPEKLKKMLSGGAVNDTEVFSITVTGPIASDCSILANSIADVAPDKIADIVEGSSVKIIDRAKEPVSPISPSLIKNVAIAAVIGFILSSLIAVLIFMFNTMIVTEDDIKKITDIPVLGVFSDFSQVRVSRGKSAKYENSAKGVS